MAGSHWGLIASLLRPHRRALAAYGAVLAITTALPIGGALVLARFVDLAVERAATSRLVTLAALFILVGVVSALATVVVTWRATALAWRITNDLRTELVDQVLQGDLTFHRDHTPGELVTRTDADVTAMTQFLSQVVARVLAIVALALVAVIVLAFVVPVLAPVLAVSLALVGVVTFAQRNSANPETVEERAAEAEAMSVAEQYLSGADDVASLRAGNHAVGRFATAHDRLVRAVGHRVGVQMRVQGTIRTAIIGAEVAMVAAGALAAQRGWVTIGEVFLGFRFVTQVRQPIEALAWRMQEVQGASGAAVRVLELAADRRHLPTGTATLPAGPIELRFDNVGLAYRDGDATVAVSSVDLAIAPGRALGLLGRTGSGKTSLARLALRLVLPTSGRVMLNGVDLATLDDAHLRTRVTAVPQEVQLFPGSVRDNVTLFADHDDGDVERALKAVGLESWLASLPDGLDTALTSDGRASDAHAGLSAGQAQLLGLARSFLHDADVVILDEATARIDPATQHALAEATRRLLHGRTAIVIAHRLETLDVCDDIAVMADGVLIEHGERTALLADSGSHYSRLLRAGAEALAEP